jgi:hypothetical protein
LVSLTRRTFSIAIAAWSAKVSTSLTSPGRKARASLRTMPITPTGAPSRSIGTPSTVRKPCRCCISREPGYSLSSSGTMSSTWMLWPSTKARPITLVRVSASVSSRPSSLPSSRL